MAAETYGEGGTSARRTSLRTLLAVTLVAATLGVIPALAGTKDQLDAAKSELAKAQAELEADVQKPSARPRRSVKAR